MLLKLIINRIKAKLPIHGISVEELFLLLGHGFTERKRKTIGEINNDFLIAEI